MLLGFPLLGRFAELEGLAGTWQNRWAQSDGLNYEAGQPSAWQRLSDGSEGLNAILGEVRSVLAITPMGSNAAKGDHYMETARTRIELVSAALSDGGSALDSAGLGHTLRWVGDLFAALDKAAGRRESGGSGEFFTLDEDPPELPPEAVDDQYAALHCFSINVSAPGVLENDSPGSWGALVSGPSHAAYFAFYSDGSFDYTPEPLFVGNDSFVYSANNGAGSDEATVLLCIGNHAPVAVADERYIAHDRAYTEDSPGVMANDDPVDPDAVVAVADTGPSNAASFSLDPDGSFDYTPDYHFVGLDTFTYHLTDGIANSDTVTVTVNVCNAAPVAEPDTYSVTHDRTLNTTEAYLPTVLENDTDAEMDGLTAVLETGPSHAESFALSPGGSFVYTPTYHFVGQDTFTYRAEDGLDSSDPATVTINVTNATPMACDDSFLVEGDPDEFVALGVLANDMDGDGDPILVTDVSAPSEGGTAMIAPDGLSVLYKLPPESPTCMDIGGENPLDENVPEDTGTVETTSDPGGFEEFPDTFNYQIADDIGAAANAFCQVRQTLQTGWNVNMAPGYDTAAAVGVDGQPGYLAKVRQTFAPTSRLAKARPGNQTWQKNVQNAVALFCDNNGQWRMQQANGRVIGDVKDILQNTRLPLRITDELKVAPKPELQDPFFLYETVNKTLGFNAPGIRIERDNDHFVANAQQRAQLNQMIGPLATMDTTYVFVDKAKAIAFHDQGKITDAQFNGVKAAVAGIGLNWDSLPDKYEKYSVGGLETWEHPQ